MVERNTDWGLLIAAVVLTATVMAGIFYIGNMLGDEKISRIEQDVKEFSIERNSQDLTRQLAENLPEENCKALNVAIEQTVQDITSLQEQVAEYEQASKLQDPAFVPLKKRYTNLLIQYWLTVNQVEEKCGSETTTVLYLYADEPQCPRCEDQGTVLTHYRQEYEEKLLVFPLDSTLGMRPVNLLLSSFNITQYPGLIIEGDVYQGFKDKDGLGNILKNYINTTAANSSDSA